MTPIKSRQASAVYDEGGHTVQQIAETFGVSRPTIYRHLAEHIESVVEREASRTARKHGFTSVSHTVELLGISANCAGNTKA